MTLAFGKWAFRCVTLLIFGLATINVSRSQIPGVFDPKGDVKDIISAFGAEMSALIAQAGGETRVTLVQGFQLSNSLIGSLKTAYGDSLNVTFDKLDTQQQKAFLDARKSLDVLGKAVREPANVALQNWSNSNELISDVAGLLTKKPLVTVYGPGYIAPAAITDKIKIYATGFRLHAEGDEPVQMTIGSATFAPVEVTDVSVGFVVPRSTFSTSKTGTSFQDATLTFSRKPDGWFNWPWTKPEKIPFHLLFTVLPEELGTYNTTTIVSVPKEDRKNFVSTPDLSATKNGGGGAGAHDCYVPEKGFKFDLTTAHLKQTAHTAYKDDDHSPGTNDGGISYKDDMKLEDNICVLVFAHTNCTECGATTSGHLEVDMVRTLYDNDTKTSADLPLLWKKDISIPLIQNAVSQIINIKLFDEISRIVVATSPQSLPFLSVDPDVRNSIVVLRPERDAMAK